MKSPCCYGYPMVCSYDLSHIVWIYWYDQANHPITLVSIAGGSSIAGWFTMENPIKMDAN